MKRFCAENKKTLLRVVFPILLLSLLCGGSFGYLETYYHADPSAAQAVSADLSVREKMLDNGDTVLDPVGVSVGVIFYPGGKVEETAYLPLLRALAQKGVLCVLCKMPFRLAVLDLHAADDVRAQFPDIERWYIGGHSLGGAMASVEAAKHPGAYNGLILLAAYSAADLSGTDLRVLSLYGSEDGVLNREKYEQRKAQLPADFQERVIEGGCHAGFGAYGPQRGDGVPAISGEQQIRLTANLIYQWIGS